MGNIFHEIIAKEDVSKNSQIFCCKIKISINDAVNYYEKNRNGNWFNFDLKKDEQGFRKISFDKNDCQNLLNITEEPSWPSMTLLQEDNLDLMPFFLRIHKNIKIHQINFDQDLNFDFNSNEFIKIKNKIKEICFFNVENYLSLLGSVYFVLPNPVFSLVQIIPGDKYKCIINIRLFVEYEIKNDLTLYFLDTRVFGDHLIKHIELSEEITVIDLEKNYDTDYVTLWINSKKFGLIYKYGPYTTLKSISLSMNIISKVTEIQIEDGGKLIKGKISNNHPSITHLGDQRQNLDSKIRNNKQFLMNKKIKNIFGLPKIMIKQ